MDRREESSKRRSFPAIGRRAALKQALSAAGGALLTSACGRGAWGLHAAPPPRAFAKVRVAADRVIRTVTGLRPFRRSGFVVRADRADDRTIVHNYGHGGGGITLSWGSSTLAVDLVTAVGKPRVAVIGCGVMGLTTARLLQDRGFEATIYAKELPPDTTSNVAGGQWSPYTVSDEEFTTPTFRQQLERASRLSNRYFQNLVGDTYGVRWIENYILRDDPPKPQQPSPIRDLFFEAEVVPRSRHPFAASYVSRFTTMLIEPAVFLPAQRPSDSLSRELSHRLDAGRPRTWICSSTASLDCSIISTIVNSACPFLRRSGFETVLQRTKLKTSTYTFEIPRAAVASTP